MKIKYGAWYLNPKTWKSRPADEPLEDPKAIQDKTLSDAKKKSQNLVKLQFTLSTHSFCVLLRAADACLEFKMVLHDISGFSFFLSANLAKC